MRKITNPISNNEPPSVRRCYNQVKFHEIVKITPYHILLTTFIFTLNFTEKTVLIFIVCFFNCTLSLILTCILRFFPLHVQVQKAQSNKRYSCIKIFNVPKKVASKQNFLKKTFIHSETKNTHTHTHNHWIYFTIMIDKNNCTVLLLLP